MSTGRQVAEWWLQLDFFLDLIPFVNSIHAKVLILGTVIPFTTLVVLRCITRKCAGKRV